MEAPVLFVLVPVVIILLYVFNCIKILREYERGVIFSLGRLQQDAKGPGLILVFPPIQKMVRIDLRQQALEVPPQDIVQVQNYYWQTQQFAQTTLRSVLGEVELDDLLAHRDKLNTRIQSILDQHTAPYGVKVSNVEVKQVDLPESMLRAMAKQAEAEREKRAKIIHAEGEFSASQRLMEAAHILSGEPIAIQLRYLQTLTEIGVEKNTTIVFPLPVDMISAITKAVEKISNK